MSDHTDGKNRISRRALVYSETSSASHHLCLSILMLFCIFIFFFNIQGQITPPPLGDELKPDWDAEERTPKLCRRLEVCNMP